MNSPSPPGPPRPFRGPLVRVLRQARGLTQDQLADAVGMSKGYLSHIENDERSPRQLMVRALARALNVPVSVLVGRTSPLEAIRQALIVQDNEPTAAQMADLLDIDVAAYRQIENGQTEATDEQLEVIARRLGVTPALLRELHRVGTDDEGVAE